jgi:hypothetical protein
LTGIDFYPKLTAARARRLESKPAAQLWPMRQTP